MRRCGPAPRSTLWSGGARRAPRPARRRSAERPASQCSPRLCYCRAGPRRQCGGDPYRQIDVYPAGQHRRDGRALEAGGDRSPGLDTESVTWHRCADLRPRKSPSRGADHRSASPAAGQSHPGARCQRTVTACRLLPVTSSSTAAQSRSATSGGGAPGGPEAAGIRRARPRRSPAVIVAAGRPIAYPGATPGPERAPHLGRVGAVDLSGVVRSGRPLVAAAPGPAAYVEVPVSTSSGVPVDVDEAAERVGVRVRGQFVGARRTDVGKQVPAARRQRGPARCRAVTAAARARCRGPARSAATRRVGHRVAVVEQRHCAVRAAARRRASGASGRSPG